MSKATPARGADLHCFLSAGTSYIAAPGHAKLSVLVVMHLVSLITTSVGRCSTINARSSRPLSSPPRLSHLYYTGLFYTLGGGGSLCSLMLFYVSSSIGSVASFPSSCLRCRLPRVSSSSPGSVILGLFCSFPPPTPVPLAFSAVSQNVCIKL